MIRRIALLIAMLSLGARMAHAEAQTVSNDRTILVMLRQPPPHARPGGSYGGAYGDGLTRAALGRIARSISARHGLTLVGDWPMPMLGIDCFVMIVPPGRSIEEEAVAVSHDAEVAWSEPMRVYHAQTAAADPMLPAQPAVKAWRLTDLHRIATGKGVRVAVIDSRIDVAHPDLAGRVTIARDFVGGHGDGAEKHGTGVAGVIAAVSGNGIGIAGVAPDARLMGLRACWEAADGTLCDTLSLAKALHFAIEHKAQVINLSLSGPRDTLLGKLIALGQMQGSDVVAAFDRKVADGGFPASQPGVIAVADAPVAAPGENVYTAPGRDVPTTAPGGKWTLANGSSYSAAHISGLIALMREAHARGPAMATLAAARTGAGAIDGCVLVARLMPQHDCACAQGCRMVSAR